MREKKRTAKNELAVKFIDIKYCDLWGRLRHVTIPAETLAAAVENGVGFDSSSVAGFEKVEYGDLVLKPDLNSAFVEPFATEPTISCFADIYNPKTGSRYEHDPRYILEKAVTAVKKETGCDEIMLLTEFEFYLFTTAEFWTDESSAVYRVTSEELKHDDQSGVALFKGSAYHVAPPFDRSTDFRSELVTLMKNCGIPVKYHHHEGGRFAQVEVEPGFMSARRAGDAVVLTKYLVRNLAFRKGRTATFMPKPIYNEPGSGMHIHQFLAKKGGSMFGDRNSGTGLSRLGRYYIGGLLEHLPSLCALTNPSTNSYRRLIPGYEAPTEGFFAIGNRTAAIRIPGYIRQPEKMALEFRVPDATCNPYLAFAAVLLAGLDGIRHRIDHGLAPDGKADSRDLRSRGKPVPTNLQQALTELQKDHDYLVQPGVFTKETIRKWIQLKLIEAEAIARRPHPWEFNLYYGC
ncbi:MAG: type I glutamate--ammonia ligase [candidate division WOR-3 bacterium]|jgi:glutamine synthetase